MVIKKNVILTRLPSLCRADVRPLPEDMSEVHFFLRTGLPSSDIHISGNKRQRTLIKKFHRAQLLLML